MRALLAPITPFTSELPHLCAINPVQRLHADNELEREATVKPYLTVQTEGEREVQR